MRYKKVLITGGSGFVGSHLSLAIRRRYPAVEVVAMDNFRRRGSELNLPRLSGAGVRVVAGDVRSRSDLDDVGSDYDLLIECSAEPSVRAGYDNSPDYLIDTNLNGCVRCLEHARRCDADVIFLSTSRVYSIGLLNSIAVAEEDRRYVLAGHQNLPGVTAQGVSEEFALSGPRSLYGTTKLAAELLIEEYRHAYGMRAIINRCGLIAGPWQMAKSDQGVIAFWVREHYFGRPLRYIGFGGNGKQVRDVLHVDDLCDLISDQMDHFTEYSAGEGMYNVGGGLRNSLSLQELTSLCEEVTGNRIPMGREPDTHKADVRFYATDHTRVGKVRGWEPKHSCREVVSDIFNWIAATQPAPQAAGAATA